MTSGFLGPQGPKGNIGPRGFDGARGPVGATVCCICAVQGAALRVTLPV